VPDYVSVRHEDTAVSMASGWSKSTGKLPAVMLHTTVGSLHAAMTLRIALHERVPMVVWPARVIVSASRPAEGRPAVAAAAHRTGGPARLVESCVKWSFGLNQRRSSAQTMQRACQLAVSAPRGPVFVSVPTEFLLQDRPRRLLAAPRCRAPAAADPVVARRAGAPARDGAPPADHHRGSGRDPARCERSSRWPSAGAPVAEAWQPYYVNFPARASAATRGVRDDDMKRWSTMPTQCCSPMRAALASAFRRCRGRHEGLRPRRGSAALEPALLGRARRQVVFPGELRTTLEGLRRPPGKSGSRARFPVVPASPQAMEGMNNPWIAER
jgi:hypothetical protein